MPRVGIVTPYLQDETTWAALHVAEVAASCGIKPSIFAYNAFSLPVSGAWDHKVKRGRLRDFRKWARGCDKLIWFLCPPLDLLIWTKHECIESTIVIVWDRLVADHFQSLAAVDRLVAPFKCVGHTIARITTGKLKPLVIP